jgi:hypothetical protein
MEKLSPKYTFCSSKDSTKGGELCNLPQGNYSYAILAPSSSDTAIYYANGTGSFTCDKSAFGGRDPNSTLKEDCFYTSIPTISYDDEGKPIGFTQCADEFDIYTPPVDTPTDILFGVDGKYVYANVTSKTPCTSTTFGDPVPYVKKACYCRLSEVPVPSPSPPSPEIPVPSPSPYPPSPSPPSSEVPVPPPEVPIPSPPPSEEIHKKSGIVKWSIIGSIIFVVFIIIIIILVLVFRKQKTKV